MAGVTVYKADTVEQHTRRKRTKYEVLEASFGGANAVTIEGCKHIECKRLQFETHIKRQHVRCRHHNEHAERRKHDQHWEFELVELFFTRKANGHNECHDRADQCQRLHETCEAIAYKAAAESSAVVREDHDKSQCCNQNSDCKSIDEG